MSVSFSPDGSRICSGSADKTIKVWDAVTGEVINILTGHRFDVRSVSFSPDGKRICSGSSYPDCTVRVWDARMDEVINILHSDNVKSKTYDNEGNEGNDDNVI